MFLLGHLWDIYDTMDRGDVASFFLFKEIPLMVTPKIQLETSLGFTNPLRLVKSGSEYIRTKMYGRSVKLDTAIFARVRRYFYPVERPKREGITENVVRDVGREAQRRH